MIHLLHRSKILRCGLTTPLTLQICLSAILRFLYRVLILRVKTTAVLRRTKSPMSSSPLPSAEALHPPHPLRTIASSPLSFILHPSPLTSQGLPFLTLALTRPAALFRNLWRIRAEHALQNWFLVLVPPRLLEPCPLFPSVSSHRQLGGSRQFISCCE